jgi:hypothetical protein
MTEMLAPFGRDPAGLQWLIKHGLFNNRPRSSIEKLGAWTRVRRDPDERPRPMLPIDIEVEKLRRSPLAADLGNNAFLIGRLSVLDGFFYGCNRELQKRIMTTEVVQRDRLIRNDIAKAKKRLTMALGRVDPASPFPYDKGLISDIETAIDAVDDVRLEILVTHKGGQPGAPFRSGFAFGVWPGFCYLTGEKPTGPSSRFLRYVLAAAESMDEADMPTSAHSNSGNEWVSAIKTALSAPLLSVHLDLSTISYDRLTWESLTTPQK